MESKQHAEQNLQKMTAGLLEKMTPVLFALVSMQQMVATRDTPGKGPVWVSRTTFKKPHNSEKLHAVLKEAFEELSSVGNSVTDFSVEGVNVQWTGFRPSGAEKKNEPDISEEAKYERLMKDVTTETVVICEHGGFY